MDHKKPDTPWHVGFIKKDEDDPRRHKSRCIHNISGYCNSTCSNYYQEKCGGSSHCGDYSETFEDYRQKLKERRTNEQIAADNVEHYKKSLVDKKQKLMADNDTNAHRYKSIDDIRRCLVCNERLIGIHHSIKQCSFCGMYYANHAEKCIPEVRNTIIDKEYFLTNYQRKKTLQSKQTIIIHKKTCQYMNQKGRCTKIGAKYTGQHCKSSSCEHYLPEK